MRAPKTYRGKQLSFEEVFRSPFPQQTYEEAKRILNKIRESHGPEYGWLEIESEIKETPRGYVAIRHHAQYK